MKFVEIKTTFEKEDEAKEMAEFLLDRKLVSCAQIFELESHYVWRNERFVEHEYMLLMKSRGGKFFKKVERAIKEKHSYEVAEIIATPICALSKEYAKWIEENTGGWGK